MSRGEEKSGFVWGKGDGNSMGDLQGGGLMGEGRGDLQETIFRKTYVGLHFERVCLSYNPLVVWFYISNVCVCQLFAEHVHDV